MYLLFLNKETLKKIINFIFLFKSVQKVVIGIQSLDIYRIP